MKSFHRSLSATLVAVTLSLLMSHPSFGDNRKEVILPLSDILTIVSQHAPGDVIKTELEHDDGGSLIYAIKVLGKDGRVRKLKIDAFTGRILRTKTEDSD